MNKDDILLPIKEGSKVKLNRNTTSFRKGDEVEVLAFRNGNPDELIVKGVLPGGFLKSNSFERKLGQARHMTMLELLTYHRDMVNIAGFPGYGSSNDQRFLLEGRQLEPSHMRDITYGLDDAQYLSYICGSSRININLKFLAPPTQPLLRTSNVELRMGEHTGFAFAWGPIASDVGTIQSEVIKEVKKYKVPANQADQFIYDTYHNDHKTIKNQFRYKNHTVTYTYQINYRKMDVVQDGTIISPVQGSIIQISIGAKSD